MLQAEEFPFLSQLGQTAGGNTERIQIPVGSLPGLAQEIETIRHKLPARSPLLKLAESVRSCPAWIWCWPRPAERAAAPQAGRRRRGGRRAGGHAQSHGNRQIANTQVGGRGGRCRRSQPRRTERAGTGGLLQVLPWAWATTKPSSAPCGRAPETDQRAWVWGLLVAAMRLSQHPDFSAVVAGYHAWMESHHPEALNDMSDPDDKRKFNVDKIAAIEAQELAARLTKSARDSAARHAAVPKQMSWCGQARTSPGDLGR